MQINPRTYLNIGPRPAGNERSRAHTLVVQEWVTFKPLLPNVGRNACIRSERQQKPITPPSPVPVYNKLFYRSGDNYLSHIIKHLEQIGGSNYRLPLGYPSPFIVLPPYITWWDLLCCAFPRNSFFFRPVQGGYIDKGVWWSDALHQSHLSSFFSAFT